MCSCCGMENFHHYLSQGGMDTGKYSVILDALSRASLQEIREDHMKLPILAVNILSDSAIKQENERESF